MQFPGGRGPSRQLPSESDGLRVAGGDLPGVMVVLARVPVVV
jgi:hypothetical protein